MKVYVVWTPVLPGDDRKVAEKSTGLIPDGRATHYWDKDKSLGYAFGKVVSLPRKRTLAWDVYFAIDGKAIWKENPPAPSDWMHQLGRDERLLNGTKLRATVEKLLKRVDR